MILEPRGRTNSSFFFFFFFFCLFSCSVLVSVEGRRRAETPGETIVRLINEYRVQLGLDPIPVSPSLMAVAQIHADDLANNNPDGMEDCNLHSWSNKGNWTSCCYHNNHKEASCMWDKPRQITSYPGRGYEISAKGPITPELAVDLWKKSKGHNDVLILGLVTRQWNAIGAGASGSYFNAWFGKEEDPNGEHVIIAEKKKLDAPNELDCLSYQSLIKCWPDPMNGRVLKKVTLKHVLPGSIPCGAGTWGKGDKFIWVQWGCKAHFSYEWA